MNQPAQSSGHEPQRICKRCEAGERVERFFDGRPMHFDGFMCWQECPANPPAPPASAAQPRGCDAETIMRFRKMLDRIGIHGYYSEMQKEFGVDD